MSTQNTRQTGSVGAKQDPVALVVFSHVRPQRHRATGFDLAQRAIPRLVTLENRRADLAVEPGVQAKDRGDVEFPAPRAPLLPSLIGTSRELESLNLRGTGLTDAGVRQLQQLEHLRWRSLSHTGVTDTGVGYMRQMTGLITLNLAGTKISDAGLKHLCMLNRLEFLYLKDTGVTRKGVE